MLIILKRNVNIRKIRCSQDTFSGNKKGRKEGRGGGGEREREKEREEESERKRKEKREKERQTERLLQIYVKV